MTDQSGKYIPQFFVTAPAPCPYLEDRHERKIFTTLDGPQSGELHNQLTHDGFRRSQRIAYKPVCEGCSACISVRIPVAEFEPTKSFQRIIKRNISVQRKLTDAYSTQEQYGLLRDYLSARHHDGGMSDMSVLDYANMVEETTVDTRIIEYRRGSPISANDRPLLGCALTDVLEDGLSMVYSFFDISKHSLSLGTFMILDHIELAKCLGLPYVYLGYWIANCNKMAYKERFLPQERLIGREWTRIQA